MNKWLAGLILLAFVVGCGQTGQEPEVLQIIDRTPALDATGVSATQTLVATFNFALDHAGMTKGNLFSDFMALGSSHTAGEPVVASLTFSPDSKTMRVEISRWVNPTSSAPVVHIIPRDGKIKDVFGNAMRTTTPLWRYSAIKNIWGTVYFANSTLPMKNGPEVYYASVSDPYTKIGTTAAIAADGSYVLSGVLPGNYYVGITGADGWAGTFAAVSLPNEDSSANININLYPADFDVLRTGTETLNAVGSFGAHRYAVGEGSSGVILQSTNDVDWVSLPADQPLTSEALIWIFENNVNGTLVVDGSGGLYGTKTPEVYAAWEFQGDATDEAVVDFYLENVIYLVTAVGKLIDAPLSTQLAWADITPPGQHINAVEFAWPVSTFEVLVCGNNGYVAQIDYQGNFVKDLRGDLPSSENLMAVACNYGRTPITIYSVVTESGAVYKTEDGGTTWQKIISGVPCSLNDLALFADISPGQDFRDLWMYVVGNNGLIMRKKTGVN